MFIANLETNNYEFYTLGGSEKSALKNMEKAWAKHSEKYHLDFNSTWGMLSDSIKVLAVSEDSYNWEGESYKL